MLLQTSTSVQQLRDTLYGTGLGFVATLAGAVFLLIPGRHHTRWLDLALSVSGGMMLSAAVFSLLLPASELLRQQQIAAQWQLVLAGTVLGGALLMSLLEKHVPHGHPVAGDSATGRGPSSRLWLFVCAIALHNIPEGLAVGVSFASVNSQLGQSVSLAIALQDFPEGFAMVMVLLKLNVRPLAAFGWSLLAATLEPVAAVIALALSSSLNGVLALTNPLALALAAGAMFFVVIHEVIPETHSAHASYSPRSSTMLFLVGFLLMWLMDNAFA
ncbi:MAG: ZIP family metal transporter [Rheinheimera sp.]|nr:ZIP family metal transporter [Rheinheimera sp.]